MCNTVGQGKSAELCLDGMKERFWDIATDEDVTIKC